jgi:hypothetical protein
MRCASALRPTSTSPQCSFQCCREQQFRAGAVRDVNLDAIVSSVPAAPSSPPHSAATSTASTSRTTGYQFSVCQRAAFRWDRGLRVRSFGAFHLYLALPCRHGLPSWRITRSHDDFHCWPNQSHHSEAAAVTADISSALACRQHRGRWSSLHAQAGAHRCRLHSSAASLLVS